MGLGLCLYYGLPHGSNSLCRFMLLVSLSMSSSFWLSSTRRCFMVVVVVVDGGFAVWEWRWVKSMSRGRSRKYCHRHQHHIDSRFARLWDLDTSRRKHHTREVALKPAQNSSVWKCDLPTQRPSIHTPQTTFTIHTTHPVHVNQMPATSCLCV